MRGVWPRTVREPSLPSATFAFILTYASPLRLCCALHHLVCHFCCRAVPCGVPTVICHRHVRAKALRRLRRRIPGMLCSTLMRGVQYAVAARQASISRVQVIHFAYTARQGASNPSAAPQAADCAAVAIVSLLVALRVCRVLRVSTTPTAVAPAQTKRRAAVVAVCTALSGSSSHSAVDMLALPARSAR